MSSMGAVEQLLVVGLLISINGCTHLGADVPQIVHDRDNRLQITLPSGWETTTIPGASDRFIQAKCSAKHAYLEVVQEAKQDLNYKSVRDYADGIVSIQGKKSKLTNR